MLGLGVPMLGLSTALHLQTIVIIIEVFLGASQKTPHHSLQWYHVVSKRAKAAETSEWCQAGAPRHRRRRNCCGHSGEARRRSLPYPAHQAFSAVEHRLSRRPLWAQLTPCRTRVGLGTRVRISHLQQGLKPFPICLGARGGGAGAGCLPDEPLSDLHPQFHSRYFPRLHLLCPLPRVPLPGEHVLIRPDTTQLPSFLGSFPPLWASEQRWLLCPKLPGHFVLASVTTLAVLGGHQPGSCP